jgi:hypothetical protein
LTVTRASAVIAQAVFIACLNDVNLTCLNNSRIIFYHISVYLVSFEMWCWRRKEKINWTDHVIMKKYYLDSKSREISYMKYVNGRRNGLVIFCIRTVFYNGLLKER